MPEPISAALITAISAGIVHEMAGDAWHAVAHRVAKALAHGRAGESTILAQLNEDQNALQRAIGPDREATSASVQARWSALLRDHAQSDPDALATFKDIASLLEQAGSNTVVNQESNSGPNQSQQVGGRGNTVAGRDVSHSNNKSFKTGGILVAVVAVVALIWGGSKIYNAAARSVSGSSITTDSKCQDWLKADENTQRQSALAAAEADGNQAEMSDGFIVQNVQYNCGYNPNATLREILKVRTP
jgi:hypothetical protein